MTIIENVFFILMNSKIISGNPNNGELGKLRPFIIR